MQVTFENPIVHTHTVESDMDILLKEIFNLTTLVDMKERQLASISKAPYFRHMQPNSRLANHKLRPLMAARNEEYRVFRAGPLLVARSLVNPQRDGHAG